MGFLSWGRFAGYPTRRRETRGHDPRRDAGVSSKGVAQALPRHRQPPPCHVSLLSLASGGARPGRWANLLLVREPGAALDRKEPWQRVLCRQGIVLAMTA